MKLTIPKAVLAPALASVGRVVERRNTMQILSNVALEAGDGMLRLRATDLDIEARIAIAARVEEPGALTVPAHMFNDIIRKAPDGDISLAATDDAVLAVKGGRFSTRLNALPVTDFPDLSAGDLPVRFEIEGPALAEAISATAFAISTEETRYYLNGIYLHAEAGRLKAVATDGHRLAFWSAPAPDGADGMPGILVPRKAVSEIAKAIGEVRVGIELSDRKIRVSSGDLILTSKLIDGTFPDYGRVIPAARDEAAIWSRQELIAAIERVITVSTERGRGIKFTIDERGTTLSVVNPDSGSATEDLSHSGEAEVEIGFNSRYALDMLQTMKGAQIRAEMADAGAPSRWTNVDADQGAGEVLYVLMPMRV